MASHPTRPRTPPPPQRASPARAPSAPAEPHDERTEPRHVEDRTVPRHDNRPSPAARLPDPRPRVADPAATGGNPPAGPGRVVPRARAIGRPTAAEQEFEARLQLPDAPPRGAERDRGPLEFIPYQATPDTVHLPADGELTQRLGPRPTPPTQPDREHTVARASRLVDPGPAYDEPIGPWILQLAAWVAVGAATGLVLLLMVRLAL